MSGVSGEELHILFLEDVETDALLVQRELRKAGLQFKAALEWTRDGFLARLDDFAPDLILSDFSMPQFNALDALALLRARGLKIPFILYTGTQSEEVAVECMKQGADDYLLKSSLTRLPRAVMNVLERSTAQHREREATEALRASEANFRVLIEHSPDALAVLAGGLVAYANPALLRYLGVSREEVEQHDFCLHVHPMDREGCLAMIADPGHLGGPKEKRLMRKDGGVVTGEINAIAIEYQQEPAIALLIRDVTERREMQTSLLLADRLASVGTLAAGVAHEINNPLGYMITNLQCIDEELAEVRSLVGRLGEKGGAASPAEVAAALADLEEPVRIARRGADRVRQIVRDLMTFSRADTESRGAVDVRDVLDFTLKMANNEIKRKAKIDTRYADILPPVLANESRLGQVFLNLIINAAQAIPEGAPEANAISIVAGVEGEQVAVTVSDTGPGIPYDMQTRIFDPFFTTKPVGVGTGLGLSICHRLVIGFGGSLSLVSEVGKGATFKVTLPALPA